jgi:hypothetical protein
VLDLAELFEIPDDRGVPRSGIRKVSVALSVPSVLSFATNPPEVSASAAARAAAGATSSVSMTRSML